MMSQAKSTPLLLTVAGGAVLLTASGCYDPYYVGGAVGYRTPYVGTVVSYQQPWYDYYYYPSVGVYFNFRTGYYYHHDRGRWRHARRLPRHIHINQHDRVHLRMRGDRPYLKHNEHRRKYRGNAKYSGGRSGKGYQRQHQAKGGSGRGSERHGNRGSGRHGSQGRGGGNRGGNRGR